MIDLGASVSLDKISLTLLLAGRLREPASDLLGLADDDLDLVAGEGLVRIISGVRVVGPCCQHGDVVDLCIYQNFTIVDLHAIDATRASDSLVDLGTVADHGRAGLARHVVQSFVQRAAAAGGLGHRS